MKPEVISANPIFNGKIFKVLQTIIRENGVIYEREIISHNSSAVIVPVFADKTVALVRQYRHAAGKYLLEVPAGSLEKDENARIGAERELEEEIGVSAENIELISEFYVSPGFLEEKMFVFLATGLTEVGQKLEDDELISVEKLTFSQAYEMIRNGEIEDAKTIIGLILAGLRFGFIFEK